MVFCPLINLLIVFKGYMSPLNVFLLIVLIAFLEFKIFKTLHRLIYEEETMPN